MTSWQRIARRIRVPLGFLFAASYIWLAHPTTVSIILGGCIAVIGLWVRAMASGHVRKNEQLTVSGPYGYTRNPLYLGSLMVGSGFALASRSWVVAAIAAVLLFAIYFPVISSEEAYLRTNFSEYEEYARQVPRLFPRLRPYKSSVNAFSWHLYGKHREYNAAIGAILMIAVLIAKAIWFPQ